MTYSLPDSGARASARASGSKNVNDRERIISAAAGGALAAWGLGRVSLPGLMLAAVGGGLIYRGVTGHCSLYEAIGVDTAHEGEEASPEAYFDRGIHLEESVTIDKAATQLYEFWRNFENLPRFMHNLESVQVHDEKRSHWVAKGPAGKRVEWEGEIINEVPGELIAWKTLPGGDVQNAGSVRFVPSRAGRGTEVKVVMDYLPPAGRLGHALAVILGRNPAQQIKNDLRRFKQFMETGEIATTQGQPVGAGRVDDEAPTGHRMTRVLKTHERSRAAAGAGDEINEASKQSVPASDPPGWGSASAG